MDKKELKEVLEKHKLWLEDKEGGERANLTDANLTSANLRNANLRNANLRNANLTSADLTNANLRNANLRNANLTSADLTDANLTNANLTNADLTDANLTNADLTNADLTDANLTNADLTNAGFSAIRGMKTASCQWFSHGGYGRMINAAIVNNEIIFYCGCFNGNEKDLRKYITDGTIDYKKSRRKAMNFLLSCLKSEISEEA